MHEEMEAFESSEDALQYLEKLVMKKGIRTGTPWRMNKRFKVCLSVSNSTLSLSINSVHSGSPIQISPYSFPEFTDFTTELPQS